MSGGHVFENNSIKGRILLVEDEALFREIVCRKLTRQNYKCFESSNSQGAMEILAENKIDLVLLDINMPGKSGIEILKDIKARQQDVAIIMVTAVADVETAINALKLGAFDYIIKPVDQKILLVSIERALNMRRLEKENWDYQLNLEKKVQEQTKKIQESSLKAIEALAYALEAKDEYTKGHSERTTEVSVAIARELALPEVEIERIRLAGILHDIGKIGVREAVLNKTDQLTDKEFEHVKTHSEIGEHILVPIIEDKQILEMVRHHHERFDGKGYPDGLKAEQIPQGARILAVADNYSDNLPKKQLKGEPGEADNPLLDITRIRAKSEGYEWTLSLGSRILAISDAYDAMTSERPYRKAMSSDAASKELKEGRGSQFDPQIVDAFFKALEKGNIK
jgi:putative two-component system response regulator